MKKYLKLSFTLGLTILSFGALAEQSMRQPASNMRLENVEKIYFSGNVDTLYSKNDSEQSYYSFSLKKYSSDRINVCSANDSNINCKYESQTTLDEILEKQFGSLKKISKIIFTISTSSAFGSLFPANLPRLVDMSFMKDTATLDCVANVSLSSAKDKEDDRYTVVNILLLNNLGVECSLAK